MTLFTPSIKSHIVLIRFIVGMLSGLQELKVIKPCKEQLY